MKSHREVVKKSAHSGGKHSKVCSCSVLFHGVIAEASVSLALCLNRLHLKCELECFVLDKIRVVLVNASQPRQHWWRRPSDEKPGA